MTVKSEYTYPKKIVIGTRGSPLALVQANMVKDLIDGIGQDIDVTLRIITTSGDWRPEHGEVALAQEAGGKAQFAKEIEEALLAGVIDIAVHSMKDMETDLPEGLVIPFMLPREDVRDVFLSENSRNICGLPMGSTVGSVSVRRQAFLLNKRPDLKVVPFRGNVQTRIDKLKSGQVDATFLARAGLNRLGLQEHASQVIPVAEMLPAVGQGAVGIELRESDFEALSFINQFSCFETMLCVSCERGVLRALGGGCHTPVGVYAIRDGEMLHLRVKVISPDGVHVWEEDLTQKVTTIYDARELGEIVGKRLKAVVDPSILN